MKMLLFSSLLLGVLAIPAAAQFTPCLADAQTYPPIDYRSPPPAPVFVNGTWQFPGRPQPIWQQREAYSQVYKLNAAAWSYVAFLMPVAGRCVGKFDSYDDRSDAYKVVQDAAGRYIRVPIRTAGNAEIIIVPDREWARIRGQISTSSYFPAFTTGRSFGSTFHADLQAGWYWLVVYNGYSAGAVSVNLSFGGRLPSEE
jgi:hypothetical protein